MTATATTERTQILLPSGDGTTIPMHFRRIPRGEFRMGDRGHYTNEEPIHRVIVDQDFWLGETPVTQAQFSAWTDAVGKDHRNHFHDNPQHPAEELSWLDATEYCRWITSEFPAQLPESHRLATLPSEAQWEYACRAGTATDYYPGDGVAALGHVGWFDGNSSKSTQAVAALQPNRFGLSDMHGNVWEWCLDRWDGRAYRRRWDGITVDQTLALSEAHGSQSSGDNRETRVLRGGSWGITAVNCRAACRDRDRADDRFRLIGLRVCLVPSPPEAPASQG